MNLVHFVCDEDTGKVIIMLYSVDLGFSGACEKKIHDFSTLTSIFKFLAAKTQISVSTLKTFQDRENAAA